MHHPSANSRLQEFATKPTADHAELLPITVSKAFEKRSQDGDLRLEQPAIS
jgi:hypothetical protein